MKRSEKQDLVSGINAVLHHAELVVVTHQQGLTVPQSRALRVKAREAGAGHKVTKNRLAKLAIKDTNFAVLDSLFQGPTAITWSKDPVAAAKVIAEYAKTNDKVTIVGGALNGNLLSAAGVQTLATLPSLDELRGKLIGLIQAPATKIAGIVQAPAAGLARVLAAHAEKNN